MVNLRRSVALAVIVLVVTFAYAYAGTGVSQLFFKHQANGSITEAGNDLLFSRVAVLQPYRVSDRKVGSPAARPLQWETGTRCRPLCRE